jgi:hypothetical protein
MRLPTIFDDAFVNELLKKEAQAIDQSTLLTNYQLANKMLNRLSAQATSAVKKQPRQTDLDTLEHFINYLRANGFTHTESGNQVIANYNDVGPVRSEEEMIDAGYLPYPSKDPKYFIHTNGLLEVLKQFERQAKSSNNLYLQELVDKLINDVEFQNLGMRPGAVRSELAKEEQKQVSPGKTPGVSEPGVVSPTGTAQAPSQQVPGQMAPKTIEETMKDTNVSPVNLLPYDPVSQMISIPKMLTFVSTIEKMLGTPEIVQSFGDLGLYAEIIKNENRQLNEKLTDWTTIAESYAKEGFYFSPGDAKNVDNFVMHYAGNRTDVAIALLSKMQSICLSINALLKTLASSPSISQLIGKDVLTKQVEIGEAYVGAFSRAASLLHSYNPNFGSGAR